MNEPHDLNRTENVPSYPYRLARRRPGCGLRQAGGVATR
jgi:hypothetical protein